MKDLLGNTIRLYDTVCYSLSEFSQWDKVYIGKVTELDLTDNTVIVSNHSKRPEEIMTLPVCNDRIEINDFVVLFAYNGICLGQVRNKNDLRDHFPTSDLTSDSIAIQLLSSPFTFAIVFRQLGELIKVPKDHIPLFYWIKL